MSDNHLISFLWGTSSVLLATSVGFLVAWLRARERVLRERAERPPVRETETLRTERIEQAIDAIAVEVERLSEAQRFTARVFAERDQHPVELPAIKSRPERSVTPH